MNEIKVPTMPNQAVVTGPHSRTALQDRFLWLLFLLLCQNTIVIYVSILCLKIPFLGFLRYSLFPILVFLAVLPLFGELMRNVKVPDMVVSLCIMAFCLVQLFSYSDNLAMIAESWSTLLFGCAGAYIVGLSWNLEGRLFGKDFRQLFYIVSILGLAISILYTIYNTVTQHESTAVYDMGTAYRVLICCLAIIYFCVKSPTAVNLFLTFAAFIYLIALGTRGPILISCVFLCVCLFRRYRGVEKLKLMIPAALFGFLGFHLERILMVFYDWFSQLGLSTRILEKLLTGEFTQSLSRQSLQSKLIDALNQRPLLGYGLFADRQIVDVYAHNILVEFWMDFGYLFGTALLVALLTAVLLAYFKTKAEDDKMVIMILFSVTVFKLMFSGSYLTEPFLFLLLGICVSILRRSRFCNTSGGGNRS